MVTPLRVAFIDTPSLAWQIVEFVVDGIFFLDILFSFLSAFYNSLDILIYSKRDIAYAYLKSWFLIDFISIIPIHLFTSNSINALGRIARVPRVYKLMKASK